MICEAAFCILYDYAIMQIIVEIVDVLDCSRDDDSDDEEKVIPEKEKPVLKMAGKIVFFLITFLLYIEEKSMFILYVRT